MSSDRELVKGRSFKLVDFMMTHGQLLFRSPKDATKGFHSNIDVAFREVAYVEATLWSFEFVFDEASSEERLKAERRLGRSMHPHLKAYVMQSGERRFLIVAGDVTVKQNDLELSESSLKHWGDCE